MKAMHKQLWGYLLITLSLAGFTPLQAQTDSADEGGYITVSGIAVSYTHLRAHET